MRLDILRSYPNGGLTASSNFPGAEYDSLWALPTDRETTDGLFEFGTWLRLEQPALTIDAGRTELGDLRVKRGSAPLPAGRRTLPVVEVDGVADLAQAANGGPGHGPKPPAVKGSAVVAHASTVEEVAPLADAAADAGARLLLVVHDGVGRLAPWDEAPWIPGGPAPLTVATLTSGQGDRLERSLDGRRPAVTVTSSPTTEYAYDVVHHWEGGVPARPTWTSSKRDLARVDVAFLHDEPRPALESRFDLWHGWTAGNQLPAPAQGERTDWVDADTTWTQCAHLPGEMSQTAIDLLTYEPRTTSEVTFFGPILRPRMGELDLQPIRYLDQMYVAVPGWGDSGSGHVG